MSDLFTPSKGGVAVALPPVEAELLRQVVAEIRAVLSSQERPDFAYRLFPPAYLDDEAAQDEFAGLMTDELTAGKLAALAAVEASLARGRVKRGRWTVSLDAEESQAWLGVLNDARLTIGTKLNVTEEDFAKPLDPEAPDAHTQAVYHWLGWLEESLVEALMSS